MSCSWKKKGILKPPRQKHNVFTKANPSELYQPLSRNLNEQERMK
jgi:hypothetical protein